MADVSEKQTRRLLRQLDDVTRQVALLEQEVKAKQQQLAVSSKSVPAQYQVNEEFKYLNNFFKRFNKVLLDKLAIQKQKEALGKDNQMLKSLLK